jgi:predicted Fe-Mo cluster-binding NifX family protein
MKIAAVTDNGTTISEHFGRARQYAVLTVEDGTVVAHELRDKQACGGATQHHDPHTAAVSSIADCEIVLARGMGQAMYQRLQDANIRPVMTSIALIQTAVVAYLEGRLKEHPELVH